MTPTPERPNRDIRTADILRTVAEILALLGFVAGLVSALGHVPPRTAALVVAPLLGLSVLFGALAVNIRAHS